MAADRPRIDQRVIAAFLDDVDLELDAAARLIADPPNRFAAFHLQQAAEKLVKAVRLSRGLRVTADQDIEHLIGELPPDDAWRTKLIVLEPLASYATSYRYPSSTGRRKVDPSHDEVLVWVKAIAGLSAEARALVGFSGAPVRPKP
jgi:HEPN domain-containing protein